MTDTALTTTTPTHTVLSLPEELARQLEPLLAAIPEAGQDGETEVLRQILEAQSIEDINRIWDADSLRDHADQLIVVHGLKWRASDFAGAFGVYLLIDAELTGGTRRVLTTGSLNAVAELVKAASLVDFPFAITYHEQQSRRDPSRTVGRVEIVP